MINIWLAQVNNAYGHSLFLPYSVGCLEAYARAQEDLAQCIFKGYIFRREPLDDIIKRIETSGDIDILAISCYLWNWEYSKALGTAVKEQWPNCLVIIGGPQLPSLPPSCQLSIKGEASEALAHGGVFDEFPSADIAVYGEGELAFAEILRAVSGFHRGRGIEIKSGIFEKLRTITGLAIRTDRGTYFTGEPQRIRDLSQLPSPYLTGCFDSLLAHRAYDEETGAETRIDWQASLESNRGCPYMCSFCAWGPESLAKFFQFPLERIYREIEWMGQQHIRYLYSCDANFGIIKRDVDIANILAFTKQLYGYPKEFRACTAKNSNDQVFEISKILHEAGMSKGATLSFQSVDPHTLDIIKRKNIKIDNFAEFLKRYRDHGIATYTELIIGLPGETRQSFEAGINSILDAGKHDGLNIYLCQVLPQTEFDDPEYRKIHGIITVRSPLLLQHSTPINDPHQEYNEIVIGTSSMPTNIWRDTYMFSWAVQAFHALGLTRYLAIFCRHELGMAYSTFYNALLEWMQATPNSNLGDEYRNVLSICESGMRGGDWGQIDYRFGNIIWPTEELTFLRLVTDYQNTYKEIAVFFVNLLRQCSSQYISSIVVNLIDYQKNLLIRPDDDGQRSLDMEINYHEYFSKILDDKSMKPIIKPESLIIISARSYKDLEEYARLVVWYGRKGGNFLHKNIICYSKD
jgi:putative methyltransferase